jgi:hypothetical protein
LVPQKAEEKLRDTKISTIAELFQYFLVAPNLLSALSPRERDRRETAYLIDSIELWLLPCDRSGNPL